MDNPFEFNGQLPQDENAFGRFDAPERNDAWATPLSNPFEQQQQDYWGKSEALQAQEARDAAARRTQMSVLRKPVIEPDLRVPEMPPMEQTLLERSLSQAPHGYQLSDSNEWVNPKTWEPMPRPERRPHGLPIYDRNHWAMPKLLDVAGLMGGSFPGAGTSLSAGFQLPKGLSQSVFGKLMQEADDLLKKNQIRFNEYREIGNKKIEEWLADTSGKVPGNMPAPQSNVLKFEAPEALTAGENGRVKWTSESNDLFVKMINDGKSYNEIGDVFNISPKAARARAQYLREIRPEYELQKRAAGLTKDTEGIRSNPNYISRIEAAEQRWADANPGKDMPGDVRSRIDQLTYVAVYDAWKRAVQNGLATNDPSRHFDMRMNKRSQAAEPEKLPPPTQKEKLRPELNAESELIAGEDGIMRWTPEADAKILERLHNGDTYRQIGDDFLVSGQAIQNRVFVLQGKRPALNAEPVKEFTELPAKERGRRRAEGGVRDNPVYLERMEQARKKWADENPDKELTADVENLIERNIWRQVYQAWQRAKQNGLATNNPARRFEMPEYKPRKADGGSIGYADGGSPFDLGAVEIKEQTPFDLGAKPVDEDWRGYPTVIGSGIAQGAITGIGKTLQGIPELYADKPQESALSKVGKSIEEFGKKKFPLTPTEEKSISGQVSKGIGTVAPVVVGGGAAPLLGAARGIAGLGATIAGAGQMGAMSAAEQAQRARAAGATPDAQRQAALTGFGINTALGFIPFHEILKPITRASPGLQSWALAKIKGATESGVVFGGIGEAQKYLGEEIAKNFYDPKAEYKPEIQDAIVNFLTGASLGAIRRAPEPTERAREAQGAEVPPEIRPRPEEPTANLERLLEGERLRAGQEAANRPIERAPAMDTLFPERQQQTTQTDTLFPRADEVKVEAKSEAPAIQMVRPTDIKIDPRYQFRTSDESGLTKAPTQAKIEAFDPAKADPILAHETTDGNLNVVNGFHRTELARQAQLAAGRSDLQIAARVLKESEGNSPAFMKQLGVYQNVAEGTGGSQAARILRDNPQGVSERLGGTPSPDSVVRDAKALASLSPEGFGLVSKGSVPPAFAAEVARLVKGEVGQLRSLDAISRVKPENIEQVRNIVKAIDPLAIERQQVLDRAIEALKKSTAENQTERASNERLAEALQTTAVRQGEIAKALDAAAKQLSDGRHINSVAPSFLARAKSIPRGKLERLQQSAPVYGGRPAGEAGATPGAVRPEPLPALTPKADSARKQMEKVLSDLIQQQVGKHVQVRFQSKIPQEGIGAYGGKFAGEKTVAGLYRPAEKIIQVAMADPRYPDLLRTALHEPFHAVQDLLATPAELKILKREDGRLRDIARKELELSPEQAKNISTSEVQAVAYDAWGRGKLRGDNLPPPITRLYNNIKEFLRKVSNAMRGLGFKSADDVFASTLKGEMAGREAREPGRFTEEAAGTPVFPSVAPDPAAAAAQTVKPTPPTDTLGPVMKKVSNAIDRMGLGDVVRDLQIKLSPMAARDATIESRAAAKDFANGIQEARYTQTSLDGLLTKNFTPEQQKRMWEAADAESVALQTGKPTNKGLSSLAPKEREFVERLQKRADEVFDDAKKLGIYEGGDDGLPSYVTRLVLMKKSDGTYERPNYGKHVRSLDSIGGKLRTTTAQMIERKYLTVEETERAAKEALGQGAEVLKNIRVLPYATGLLQEAVAGRMLINRIKDAGKEAGADTVVAGKKPEGNWFTIDHPAFYNTHTDANGALHKTPIYVRADFEGPLRSVLEQGNGGKIYRALMDLKGKTMSIIMMSPLIHNQVEFGRALPAMPGKVLTGRIYFEGNKAKNDPDVMREAIRGGLVPIGHRGYMQDISSVPEMPNLAPGRSITSKVLAAVPGLFSKTAGTAVKRAVDKAGDFWHNTLLWDRIGDLQMGLYTNLRDNLINKGFDPLTAQRAAAHWANRYAGAIPVEAMSANARKIANLMMFSRSFTLGNLGVMKDSYSGLPRDVQAQIARDAGLETLSKIKGVARRKATAVVMLDMAMFYVMNSLLQSAVATMGVGQTASTVGGTLAGVFGGSLVGGPAGALVGGLAGGALGYNAVSPNGTLTMDEEIQKYKDRFAKLMKRVNENPLEVLAISKNIDALSSTSENEPSRRDRPLVGYQKDGTAIYMTLPPGKIGHEFLMYQTSPLEMMHRKLSTWAKPVSEIWANSTGLGNDAIYNKNAEDPKDQMKAVGDVVWHLMKSQVPGDWIQSLWDLETGHGDKTTNLLKTIGPLAGATFAKGAPTGEAYGDILRQKEQQRFALSKNRDTLHRLIEDGKTEQAIQLMEEMKFDKKDMQTFLKMYGGGPRVSKGASKKFMQQASPEEIENFMRHLDRGQSSPPAGSPFDLGATPRP